MVAALSGCLYDADSIGRFDIVWGRRGISDGRFQKPRAMAIDDNDHIYVVDMTARIQVFDVDGNFLRSWKTPISDTGKPSGLSIDRDGRVLVADTHYYRILVYTPLGELLESRTLGGEQGSEPGKFGFVTDAVQDSTGAIYVSEYGSFDRIQKFTSEGEFLFQWGGRGSEPGQFLRPQNMVVDEKNQIWIVDACNHRIQVFDATGEEPRLVKCWGELGSQPGQLRYPFDLALDGKGHLYVCELGNNRVQKFTLDGESLGCWGIAGRDEGELSHPWALVLDQRGRLHVLDTYNHRVQRVRM